MDVIDYTLLSIIGATLLGVSYGLGRTANKQRCPFLKNGKCMRPLITESKEPEDSSISISPPPLPPVSLPPLPISVPPLETKEIDLRTESVPPASIQRIESNKS